MKAVILAGGLGSRLKPFTEVIPKPLLPLGQKSLMEVQIRMLERHGFDHFFVATNYMSDYVEAYLGDGSKFGVTIELSREQKPLGTAGPLGLLRDRLDEPFLVMNGDILTKLDFTAFYKSTLQCESMLTVGTKIITTPFRFGNVTVDQNNHLVDVDEKPELSFEILAGIYGMRPEILDHIPYDEFYGVDDLIRDFLARSITINRYLIHEYWLDIGQVDDYSVARQAYSENFEAVGL
jgi:NDP-sugar pyrophosphorylase family protein